MILRMVEDSKKGIYLFAIKASLYVLLSIVLCALCENTALAIGFAEIGAKNNVTFDKTPMPTAKYKKGDTSKAVVESAKACQNVEYTAEMWYDKGGTLDGSKRISMHDIFTKGLKRKDFAVYKKCADLGYCIKDPTTLKQNRGKRDDHYAVDVCRNGITDGFNVSGCVPWFCQHAFDEEYVRAKDCAVYNKSINSRGGGAKQLDITSVSQHKHVYIYATCVNSGLCKKDEYDKGSDCSKAVKQAKAEEEAEKKAKDKDKDKDKDNTPPASLVKAANDIRNGLNRTASMFGENCIKAVDKVVDDCLSDYNNNTKDKIAKCVNDKSPMPDCIEDKFDNSDQKKCSDNAGFFGFFWCPGINLLTEVFDTITGMITGGLKWTILVDTRSSSENVDGDPHHIIYNAWSSVLGIANIIMLIGFIAILYSYALNSNNVAKAYTVKTLVSRLIVVAIATNFSFYICAALADLSNIAGVGIYDLIRSMIPGNGDGPFSISGLGTAISMVVGATILIVLAYMSLHLVILSLILILALITLRQVALLMLVIMSPVAFACYLFPNTAKWFTKWWNYYIQLLIVFPLFTAVWASSRLVASVLELTHQSNLITTVLSAVTPLIAIIPIFKMSGGLMSKMTGGLQKRASKWKGHDDLRRKRVANFAKRNSMALQNKLGSVQLGDHGMGRILSGAAHLAGGGIGIVGGTLAAAANTRASDNLEELSKQAVKDINKKYDEKQDDKSYKKMENFAKKDHTVSEEMANEIKQKFGADAVTDKDNKVGNGTHPVITGAIAVKYMAMTGRGLDGKLLDQNIYRAALKYADEHIIMSNDEFNIAVYNVQQNGDKNTRSDFIKRHIDPEETDHPIFMTESDKNDFINQNGLFDKDNFSDDKSLISAGIGNNTQIDQHKSGVVDSALDHSRSQYISSLNSNEYVNLSDSARAKLTKQIVEHNDVNSAGRLRSLHTRVYRDINILNVNNNVKYSMHMTDMVLSGIINKYSHGNSGSKPAPGTSSNTNTGNNGNTGNSSNSGQGATP